MNTANYWIKAQDVLDAINDEIERGNEEGISEEYAAALNNAYHALIRLTKFW